MHDKGITVPTITNEVVATSQKYQPGPGLSKVNVHGYDNHALGFSCGNHCNWPDGKLPINYWELDDKLSNGNPNSIMGTSAGGQGIWGGYSDDDCSTFLGPEFEEVVYKYYVSFSTTIQNFYMIFSGTNLGDIAAPVIYTSYDYGSSIRESRMVDREKYSVQKLLARFLKVSPAYLTTLLLSQYLVNTVNGSDSTTNASLATTQLADVVGNKAVFWIIGHAAYNSLKVTSHKL